MVPVYDYYARVQNGQVVIRHSTRDQWGRRGWPPKLAREFAAHILALADQAEREDPRVKELMGIMDANWDDSTLENLALVLWRAGYRKKATGP